jgi:predicted acyl esterase
MSMPFSESEVRMADGTSLHTTLVLPPGSRPVPVLLLRTPYDARSHADEAAAWARHGFGMAVQDVRGRYRSEGEWSPYQAERDDGWHSLHWLAGQRRVRCVVPAGGSYSAGCALAVADHPAVRAVLSSVPAVGLGATVFGPEGVPHLERHAWWWSTHGEGSESRPDRYPERLRADPDLLAGLPVVGIGDRLGLRRWSGPLSRNPDLVTDDDVSRLTVPSLHIGGWWDTFADTTWSHARLTKAGTVHIGPWSHRLDGRERIGAAESDPRAWVNIGRLQLDWLRAVLAGADPGAGRHWIGGDRGWVGAATSSRVETWAITANRELAPGPDGGVARVLPWDHDPASPLPGVCWPVDIAAHHRHPDCLRVMSAPLERPLTLLGKPVARIALRTEARPGASTDVVARLGEQRADGRILPLSYGITEVPCGAEDTAVGMRPTGVTLPAGSRLVLDLAGGFFPLHPRNPQQPGDRLAAGRLHALRRWLLVGVDASRLELPVLDEKQG